MVTWGTSPEDVVSVNGLVPNPESAKTENKKKSIERSLEYMGLQSGTKITDIKLDKIFIGSCTNGRIEDLRTVATIVKDKKIASHIQAMIVPGVAFLIPTSIWLLKSYFEKIPVDLEEAAFVDGASRVQILRHIIAPLSTPGLVVVGIYAFIGAYAQQFLFAITFNQKKEYMPIPSGLYEFIGYQSVKWNEMMAASLVGIAPVLILFIFLQKYIVEGLTAGAVKN